MNIPVVQTLREAVSEVIESSRRNKFPPARFMAKVGDKERSELRVACEELIFSKDAEMAMCEALQTHPRMWTLEDFVRQQGASWGFSHEALQEVDRRVKEFDTIRQWAERS